MDSDRHVAPDLYDTAVHFASPSNPQIKQLVRLHAGAGRREAGAFLVEGRRAISGFIAAGWRPQLLLIRDDMEHPAGWTEVTTVSAAVAAKVSTATTPSGYTAVFPIPPFIPPTASRGGLVLAGIADPGNLGTLLRTAAAFAITDVVLVGGADPFAPKVVQASAGALANVRLHPLAEPSGLAGGAVLCGLVPRGGFVPAELPTIPRWLVVGSEADGIPPAWLDACTERMTLSMPGAAESLNAAVAGGIGMWELFVRGVAPTA